MVSNHVHTYVRAMYLMCVQYKYVILSRFLSLCTGSADYTPANGVEMVFAPNISFLVMEIAITEDSVLEEAEDFSVTLTTTEERVRVEDSLATVIITDDDCKFLSVASGIRYVLVYSGTSPPLDQ